MEVPGGKLIDLHAHLWRGREDKGARETLQEAELFDVEYIAISHLPPPQSPPEAFREGNDRVAQWVKRSGGLFRGQAVCNPRYTQAALDELQRCYEVLGMRMVKLWISARCVESCVLPVVEKCIDLGMPILQHAFRKATGNYPNESTPMDVASLGRRYPNARIEMAHIAGDYICGTWAIRDVPNVSTDISGSYCEAGMVETAVRELGAGRVIFGTDNGIAFNLGKVQDARISDEDKARVLYHNAKELLP